jgi:hypothetical protein
MSSHQFNRAARTSLARALLALLLVTGAGCASAPHEKHPGTLPSSLPEDEYAAFDVDGRRTHECQVVDQKTLSCTVADDVDPNAALNGPLQQDGLHVVGPSLVAPKSDKAHPIEVVRDADSYDVRIRVTRDAIFVNEKRVVNIVDDRVPAEFKTGPEYSLLIRPLRSILSAKVSDSDDVPSHIVIADKMVPYRIITEVAYTLAQAKLVGDTLPQAVVSERFSVLLYCEPTEESPGKRRICHAVGPEGASLDEVSTIELVTVGHVQTLAWKTGLSNSALMRNFCDPDHIRGVLSSARPRIKACFEAQLSENPELAGKAVVQFKIMPDASIQRAEIFESTLNSLEAETCIVDVLRELRFQKPDGGICVIRYPFVFNDPD